MRASVLILILGLTSACLAQKYEQCTFIKALVVNGREANCIIPWLVSLRDSTNEHHCAGSLIHPRIVLTAAHCLDNIGRLKTVDIGRVDRIGDDGSGFESREVVKTAVHDKYDKLTFDHDIALLVLNEDSSKKLAPLARSDYCFYTMRGCEVNLVGWGRTAFQGPVPDTLMTAEARSVTRIQCIADYRSFFQGASIIQDTMICATGEGIDTCTGDSGGPLIVNGAVMGIVSSGYECAHEKLPGIYTSVPKLRGWIDSKLAELS